MVERMSEYPDKRVWSLTESEVTRLCINYSFIIQIWNLKGDLTLAIHTTFLFRVDGREEKFDPQDGASLGPALIILHKPVETLTIFQNGFLNLRFLDGTEVVVEKNLQYESWESSGSGEFIDLGMLCSPHEGPPWRDS